MDKRRSRFVPGAGLVEECLEERVVLSATSSAGAAEIAARTPGMASTRTTLAVQTGTLAQPITFAVTVRAPASSGAPTGTVQILDHGQLIETLTLSPSSTTSGKFATSSARDTLTPTPGGDAYYFGKHQLTAVFVPSGAFSKSTANKTFTVRQPSYTTLAGGVKVATIAPGSGAGIQSGQTASMLYTGYLQKNGAIFDDSLSHGGSPFSFTVGAGQVIPGFDGGAMGMKVGETRIVSIPAAEAYGNQAVGSIPANSNLVFVLTLKAIS